MCLCVCVSERERETITKIDNDIKRALPEIKSQLSNTDIFED